MSVLITLNENSESIQYLCRKDKRLAKVISMVGPITYWAYNDAYSFLVHEIIEQMLSVKASAKIFGRLEGLCDGIVTPEKIDKLTDEQIKSIGTANSKIAYIRNLTNAVLTGEINFSELPVKTDEEVFNILISLKGVGSWTAKMYLIFILDRQDVLPTEDVAFLQAYEWMYNTKIAQECQLKRNAKNGSLILLLRPDTYIAH